MCNLVCLLLSSSKEYVLLITYSILTIDSCILSAICEFFQWYWTLLNLFEILMSGERVFGKSFYKLKEFFTYFYISNNSPCSACVVVLSLGLLCNRFLWKINQICKSSVSYRNTFGIQQLDLLWD